MDNSLTLPFTGKLNLRLGYTEMLRQVKCPYIRLNADGVCLKETEVGCYDKDSNYLIWNEVFRVKLLQVTKISVVIFDKRLLGDDDFVAIGEVELSKLTNGGKKNVMLKHKVSCCCCYLYRLRFTILSFSSSSLFSQMDFCTA